MWFFLWILFVLAMVGFFLWSYHATYEQKKAWKAFSSKFNLQYIPGKMMQSPAVSGQLKDRLINIYSQIGDSTQGQAKSQTVIEVFLNDLPDVFCAVTSQNFIDFMTTLDLPEPFVVDSDNWPKQSMARTFEDETPSDWFLEKQYRIDAIKELFKLPFDVAFVSGGDQSFVAIRTPNPLNSPKKINQVIGKLFKIAKDLEKNE